MPLNMLLIPPPLEDEVDAITPEMPPGIIDIPAFTAGQRRSVTDGNIIVGAALF
jgi:hypothetical protein